MIERKVIDGGWYGEALPSGEYAVAIAGGKCVETHAGRVSTEPRDLLFVRCTNKGGFRFAGQEADQPDRKGDGNYEYPGGDRKGDSFGVNPVIYDLEGNLYQAVGPTSHQGYRYVGPNNIPLTGDQTFHDPATDLFEYTRVGDLIIGQGHESGAIIEAEAGRRYLLEPGHCTFIRASQEGSRIAVTIVKLTEDKTVIYWLDRTDVFGLPLAPDQTPPSNPPPEPPKEDPKVPNEPASQIDKVDEVLKHYPERPLGPKHGEALEEIAYVTGAKLLVKPGSGVRVQGIEVSQDGLVIDGYFVDCLGDAENAATPAWTVKGPVRPEWTYVTPRKPAGGPQEPPGTPPPTPTPSFDPKPLLDRLNALEAALTEQAGILERAISRLEAEQFDPSDWTVKADCGRAWGHAHSITARLERK